ncbi:SDR family oxidoreductase [bacterium]|nr:SDR family oxidoreductase [bacterium]
MAGRVIFFTGFPGFIGKRLVAEILSRDTDTRFIFLVQEKFLAAAREAIASIPGAAEASRLAIGDITMPNLGLSESDERAVAGEATEVWHLAAVYDLAVDAATAQKVNVEGTRNVLDLCEKIENLSRHVYFSTCYVSGTRTDTVFEHELSESQAFKNHYEATKYHAEVLVRRRETVTSIIIRPAIVIGDSKTGEADKYDGPYPMILLLARLARRGLLIKGLRLPAIGARDVRLNLVPVDFVVGATVRIATRDDAVGKTFQLADPAPMTLGEFAAALAKCFSLGEPFGTLPIGVVRLLMRTPGLRRLLDGQEEALVYMEVHAAYDTRNTDEALAATNYARPDIREYLPNIVEYVRRRLDGARGAMY